MGVVSPVELEHIWSASVEVDKITSIVLEVDVMAVSAHFVVIVVVAVVDIEVEVEKVVVLGNKVVHSTAPATLV